MRNKYWLAIFLAFLANYLASQPYSPIQIDDSFGTLIYESEVGHYTLNGLYKFYKSKVCYGIYWFNCQQNLRNIKQYASLDLSRESSIVGQQFSQINAYKVLYSSVGLDKQAHKLSGAILIPKSEQALKGVVVFYHYTVLNKDNVPSNFNKDEFNISKALASTIASAGYLVILPDYLGLGANKQEVHPYILYPSVNALSGIYMLKLLAKLSPTIPYRFNPGPIPLYLSGYSEGGAYSLWAAKILQDNPSFLSKYGFRLTKTIPIDGAYNLSQVTLPFILDSNKQNANHFHNERISAFSKPALVANVLNSYAHYSLNGNESAVFTPKFLACNGCEIGQKSYSISSLLQAPVQDVVKYKLIYQAALSNGYSPKNDSILSFTQKQLLETPAFKQALQNADIYSWQATTPISFLTLAFDSIVPRLNTETAYHAMAAQGSPDLTLNVISNHNFKVKSYIPFMDNTVDHPQAFIFMLLFLRMQLNEAN